MRDYSNYHTSSKDVFVESGKRIFEITKQGFDGYQVKINGLDCVAVIQDKYSDKGILKKILIDAPLKTGDVVEIKTDKWLVISPVDPTPVYNKSYIEISNNTLHIKTGETKVQSGTDPMGRPVYTTTPTFTDLPCIVKSKYYTSDSNSAINLPNGQSLITIPYSNLIKENMEFEMYNRKFKIIGIDFSKVINDSGILIITAERVV